MDISRLAQIIDAFSDVFNRVKSAEQLKLAIVLRRVIWNFITRCGGTFIDMHRKSFRPPTNRIEQLMEGLRSIIDAHARSSAHPAFYQLMVMLLMICPDTIALAADHAIEHGEAREDGCSKHVRCLARIHQHLTTRDVPESIVLASQELQRVASVLTVLPGNNVARLSDMFEADLNSVLLDSGTRLAPYREEPIDPKLLLISNMACQFQLNPEKSLQLFLPRVTSPKTEPWMQLVFVHAVNSALAQRYYLKSINEVTLFNKLIAKLFLDLLRRNVDTIQTISEQQAAGAGAQARSAGYGRRLQGYGADAAVAGYGAAARSICDMALNVASTGEKMSILPPNEIAQRVQLVAMVLGVVAEEPRLVIWGENEDAKFESIEAIVGAISTCIQEPSIAIQRRAGLALCALFNPVLLSEWVQSADIAFAMWTLSLQVIQGICRAIVHSMVTSTMAQHRQLLEIMFDMLVLSNCILELSSGVMGTTMEMAEYPQFEVAFEVVIMLHLWADDADITQLIQECIRLKIQGQQLMLDAGIPVDPTLSNHRLYQELDAGDVKQASMYSRLARMRAIFRTIRKNMRPTAGAQAAWQETYKLWRQMLLVLLMREETTRVPDGIVPAERDAASPSAGTAVAGGGSTSVSSGGDKDDKREAVSRRRNVFEKLTGHSTKSGLRNASGGSQPSGTAAPTTIGSALNPGSVAQRIGGGVAGSPV
ncbi:Ras GTPase activating protein ira2, partial [Coemansia furcata]